MLDPGNSEAFRTASLQAFQMGQSDEALHYAKMAVALDPLEAKSYSTEGYAQQMRGALTQAESTLRKALELNDTGPQYHYDLGEILLAEGQASAALAVVRQETAPVWRELGLILVFDALGRSNDADLELAAFEKEYASSWAYSIVEAYAARGDVEQAFAWLDRAYRQHDVGLVAVKTDPLLKNLQPDTRYKAFLRKMNLSE